MILVETERRLSAGIVPCNRGDEGMALEDGQESRTGRMDGNARNAAIGETEEGERGGKYQYGREKEEANREREGGRTKEAIIA